MIKFDITLRNDNREISQSWKSIEDSKIIVREVEDYSEHTLKIIISDQLAGEVFLNIEGHKISVPTYKMTLCDDKTNEISIYQVTRDVFKYLKSEKKRNFLSFFGLNLFEKEYFLYENISFEENLDTKELFLTKKRRELTSKRAIYEFSSKENIFCICSGEISQEELQTYCQHFYVIEQEGQNRFIGDMLYREKMLKKTPSVFLEIIKRKKIAQQVYFSNKGKTQKVIYY